MAQTNDNDTDVGERWWSDLLQEAVVSDDHTVELTAAEPYGAQVVVDGVPMFSGEGYPWETFTIGEVGEFWGVLTEDGREKLEELHSSGGHE